MLQRANPRVPPRAGWVEVFWDRIAGGRVILNALERFLIACGAQSNRRIRDNPPYLRQVFATRSGEATGAFFEEQCGGMAGDGRKKAQKSAAYEP